MRPSVVDDDDDNDKIQEEPSSWHHAMRLKVLLPSTAPKVKIVWFVSSYLLIFTQIIVLLSFNTSLSFKRCTIAADECLGGSYCSGTKFLQQHQDPLGCNGAPCFTTA